MTEQAGQPAKIVRVGVAIIEHNGRYLVGVRSQEADLPGQSEFPGGKCEPDESPDQSAVRETLEETGLAVEAVRCLDQRVFEYEHATVDLNFWLCRLVGTESNSQHGHVWLNPNELDPDTFPSANRSIIEQIRSASPFLLD